MIIIPAYCLFVIILALFAFFGYLIGYYRGFSSFCRWDEKFQKEIFVAGWENGFLYKLNPEDHNELNVVNHKALEHFDAWKGYPHNRKH